MAQWNKTTKIRKVEGEKFYNAILGSDNTSA